MYCFKREIPRKWLKPIPRKWLLLIVTILGCAVIWWFIAEPKSKKLERAIVKAQKSVLLELFRFVINLAKENGWTHFMPWGTLLGSWRHHGLIPWDTDIDLFIELKHRPHLERAIRAHPEYDMLLTNEIKMWSKAKSKTRRWDSIRGEWMVPYLDIYFFEVTATHVHWSQACNHCLWLKTDIFPLHERLFEGMMIPAPHNPLKLLHEEFGPSSKCVARDLSWIIFHYRCQELDGIVPFVHRNFSDGIITETLKLGDRVLNVTTVKLSGDNMPLDAFTLAHFESQRSILYPLYYLMSIEF